MLITDISNHSHQHIDSTYVITSFVTKSPGLIL